MRRLLIAGTLILASLPAHARDLIPDRRLIVTRDVDFYGADLQALFDTTLDACQAVCLNDPSCRAFTFNRRSNACFPKSEITDRQPYEGAISAQVVAQDPTRLARARSRAADLGFLKDGDLDAAMAQAGSIALRHGGGAFGVEAVLDASEAARARGTLAEALHWAGAAAAQSDAAAHWLLYAKRALDHAATPGGTDPRRLRAQALSASVNAYLRSSEAERTNVLLTLAQALEQTGRGRDMVPALRVAEGFGSRADVTAALDKAIGTYGFRITEHEVTADSADPRICVQFSDPLIRAGQDYAPFVRLPDPRLAVEADDQRLCVSGVVHGERYTLTFRAGLPAADGEALVRDVPITAYVRDRTPAVTFPGRAYVLPRSNDAGLPVETVNLDALDLTLLRVSDRNLLRTMQDNYFGRPLSSYALDHVGAQLAETVWTGTGDVENSLNADVTTRLPIGEVIGHMPPGVYALTAAVPGADRNDNRSATQWFILSDIGISTLWGSDGLLVAARSLGTAEARAGLDVQLVSRSNRVLAEAVTDADGIARFGPGLVRGTGGAAPSLIVARDAGTDMAFLSLTDPGFDLSDRGVAGREPSGPIDAFLTTDRGAYRAGEVIHATALLRDAAMRAIADVPVTAVLSRPDGVEHSRFVSSDDVAGGQVFILPLAAWVARGTWQLALYADPEAPALAITTVLVEDFVPERIDFDLTLPDGPIDPLAPPLLDVAARYLFGAPGADLPIEGTVTLSPLDRLEAWPGYRFGRHDAPVDATSQSLPDGLRTDADGHAQFAVPLADVPQGQPMTARATLRLSEGSGRPVERSIRRPVAPSQAIIGIRPAFDDTLPEGAEARFDLMGLGPDLSPGAMQVTWQINRVSTRYQWYQHYGNWNWEPVTTRSSVARGIADLGSSPVTISAPVDWGRYEVVVERTDGPYVASSMAFDAGWYAPANAAQTPDTLELSLDAETYRAGDVAKLRIVPRFAGTAVIAVLSDRVVSMQSVEVHEGETVLDLPVTEEWGTGAYVTARIIRPMDAEAGQAPGRALGLSHAAIAPDEKALDVRIDTAPEAAPRSKMTARVQVSGVAEGETAHVTLAAVDVGILNLTGFPSPDPSGHYFGQRRLGVEMRDLYGRLIDGMNGAMGQIRSGGDAGAQMRMESPPPTEELVAIFEGPVAIGPEGFAKVTFDMPDFNGTLRLMAVAWSDGAVGQAATEVLVRDPVVMAASLPRFLAPGDASRLLLELTHATGATGRMRLDVEADGVTLAGTLPSDIDIGVGESLRLRLPLRAEDVGDHEIRIALTTPDGQRLTKTLTLAVRATDPAISATRRFSLAPGATFRLDADVLTGFEPQSAALMVSAGPLARFDVPGLLASLGGYPYGCTEQVTSQAMPLLTLSSLAEPLGLGNSTQIEAQLDRSVTRILTRQSSNGAFGLWSAGSGDFWLDAYVTDFLSRARAQGIAVSERAFQAALDNLANRVAYAPDFDDGGVDISYALMVLAREGRATMGDLRYYADEKRDAFATPLAAAQLGAALASYGDPMRADRMFARAGGMIDAQRSDARVWRADYGSALRDAAGVLSLAVEARSDAVDRDRLSTRITGAARPLSTQEQVWSLMAAQAMVTDPAASGLSLDGVPLEGPFLRRIDGADLGPMTLTNTATTPTDITLTTLGVPIGATDAGGYGYAIERAYYTMQGAPLSDPVQSGDRLVAVLTVRPAEAMRARLMINDALPAGFEIDNPNLLRAGDIRALDWLNPTDTEHVEFRTDRFLAAVDQNGDAPIQLAYIVRAVSPGTFHHPAALVEDMYRPEYRATTASGALSILP